MTPLRGRRSSQVGELAGAAGERGRTAGPRKPARSLKARAIALLARRDYARAELERKLLRMRVDEDDVASRSPARRAEVDALLDELAALGYLSDERYAQSMVARRSGTHSRRAIAEELKARGVAGSAVDEALAASGADDAATMRELWERRFGARPADDRERARQVRFLQSRGFSISAILRFLRELPATNDGGHT